MPRGKKQPNASSKSNPNEGRRYYASPDAVWGGYVDLRLDDDRHHAFDLWYADETTDWYTLLSEDLAEGLSLSAKWDAESQCYIVSYAGCGVSNSNERYVLTARATTFFEALALVIYKHNILMERAWDNFKPRTSSLNTWG